MLKAGPCTGVKEKRAKDVEKEPACIAPSGKKKETAKKAKLSDLERETRGRERSGEVKRMKDVRKEGW